VNASGLPSTVPHAASNPLTETGVALHAFRGRKTCIVFAMHTHMQCTPSQWDSSRLDLELYCSQLGKYACIYVYTCVPLYAIGLLDRLPLSCKHDGYVKMCDVLPCALIYRQC